MKLGLKEYKIDKTSLPNGLIYSGILYSFVIGFLGFLILFLLPIQEKIKGKAILYTTGIPLVINSPEDGKLFLMAQNFQAIEAKDIIATINWDISTDNLMALESLSDYSLDYQNPNSISDLDELLEPVLKFKIEGLAGLISAINSSTKQFELLKSTSSPKSILEKIDLEIAQRKITLGKIDDVATLLNKNYNLINDQLKSDLNLYQKGAISLRDYDIRKSDLLLVEEKILNSKIQLEAVKAEIAELESQKSTINSSYEKDISGYQLNIYEKLDEFKNRYHELLDMRVIRSPIAGTIEIDPYLHNKESIRKGQQILTILPSSQHTQEKMFVLASPYRIGEIAKGQKVFIELDEFESINYGFLQATVIDKSALTYDGKYRINIALDNGLITNRKIALPFQQVYNGNASIKLTKKSLAQGILDEIRIQKERFNQ